MERGREGGREAWREMEEQESGRRNVGVTAASQR